MSFVVTIEYEFLHEHLEASRDIENETMQNTRINKWL